MKLDLSSLKKDLKKISSTHKVQDLIADEVIRKKSNFLTLQQMRDELELYNTKNEDEINIIIAHNTGFKNLDEIIELSLPFTLLKKYK